MIRTCKWCGGPNDRVPQARYCSYACRHKSYRESDHGRAVRKAYTALEKTKLASRQRKQTDAVRAQTRATRYGITVAQLQELLAAGCFAPNCGKVENLHIDHDHACCSRKGSCGNCIRGAICGFHNKYLGFLEADWQFAIWAMRQPSLALKIRREA